MQADNLTLYLGLGRGKRQLEISGKFIETRQPTELKGYPYRYAIRHSDRNNANFSSLERCVVVNFAGHFFAREEVLILVDWLPIREWNFTGDY